ncbi:hypothetical protein [Pedobacter psychrophilus]|nr:hypothetical protein [Pedobacter psychrophilus]
MTTKERIKKLNEEIEAMKENLTELQDQERLESQKPATDEEVEAVFDNL